MTRLRKRTTSFRSQLSEGWITFLCQNCGRVGALAYLRDDPAAQRLFTDAEYREQVARQMWDQHGDAITAEWIATHPGTRPAAWWLFSAPAIGPRRKIPRHYPAEKQEKIRKHSGEDALQSLLRVSEMYPGDEPERDFLERNGLLSDAEIGRCSK